MAGLVTTAAGALACSTLAFKGPGYSADVVLDRATGKYDVTETKMGVAAVRNDRHKSRDTGPAWSLFLDVVPEKETDGRPGHDGGGGFGLLSRLRDLGSLATWPWQWRTHRRDGDPADSSSR